MAESRSVTLYRDSLLYVFLFQKTQASIFVILLEALAARIYACMLVWSKVTIAL
jgi:hypothetical protein